MNKNDSKRGLNVLSLFDGISCGQIALDKLGIKVDNYFASEIDKYAITITQYNYPKTKQIGDVTKVSGADLPKIDLVIGGSPCQGFSFAGKKLAFDDPRSKLFFEYVRILDECRAKNPQVQFLLENVRMKKEHIGVISKYLGVDPVKINSSLVSAQNRVRLYWTNISESVQQPEDKQIVLRDIIESGVHGGIGKDKSSSLDCRKRLVFKTSYIQWDKNNKGHGSQDQRAYYLDGKHGALTASGCGSKVKVSRYERPLDTSNSGLVFVGGIEKGRRLFDGKDLSRNYREGYRVYSMCGKSCSLSASSKGGKGGFSGLYGEDIQSWRKLTPTECERLQTVPDNYTLVDEYGKQMVSDSQRYKALGNGWTIDVIAWILKDLN